MATNRNDAINSFIAACLYEFEESEQHNPPRATGEHNERVATWVLRALANVRNPMAKAALDEIQAEREQRLRQ